jgi:PAS domain-containing protein
LSQRPLQLILARNFLASIGTPAFLVDGTGVVAFYNDAAGGLLGRRFEETGLLSADDWSATFGPYDDEGRPIPFEALPLTHAGRRGRPAHAAFRIRAVGGTEHRIEASSLPIVDGDRFQGAIVVFWPVPESGTSDLPVLDRERA